MQTITHYIKLFVIFMMMTLFSSHLYGADAEITVASIKIEPVYEGQSTITSHIIMTGKINESKNYKYNIVKSTTDDLNTTVKFTNGVTHNDKTHQIIVPKNIDTFDMLIEVKNQGKVDLSKTDDAYNITIGNKISKTTIINIDS